MWAPLASVALGLWLMASPGVLGYGAPASTSSWIVGPVAASLAFLAAFEITRGLRWLNLPLAAWLLAAPWLLGYDAVPLVNSLAVGAPLGLLALVSGTVEGRYGGGWSSLVD